MKIGNLEINSPHVKWMPYFYKNPNLKSPIRWLFYFGPLKLTWRAKSK